MWLLNKSGFESDYQDEWIYWVSGYFGKSAGPILQHCSMGGAEAERWDTGRGREREREGECEGKDGEGVEGWKQGVRW